MGGKRKKEGGLEGGEGVAEGEGRIQRLTQPNLYHTSRLLCTARLLRTAR